MAYDPRLYGTGLPGDPLLGDSSQPATHTVNTLPNDGGEGVPEAPPNAPFDDRVTYTNDIVNPRTGAAPQSSYNNFGTKFTNAVSGPQGPDPYAVGMEQIIADADRQAALRNQYTIPWMQAAGTNYYTGVGARNDILNQQNSALGAFSAADAGLYGDFANTNAQLAGRGNQAVSTLGDAFGRAGVMDTQNVGALGNTLGQANSMNAANVSELRGQLGQANAMDAANVGQLNALNGSMRQLTAGGYGADVVSNPEDLARQESAYGTFGNFANGAYDYQSQAAQAYADPEALAAQKEVMGKFRSEMDPRLTDAERYLYMQARLQEEQTNRGNRDANLRELERSGMSGSTMALSNLNASSQQTATTRALADLGANAKAIDRAQRSAENYGNMANVVSGQSFQQAFGRGQAADAASQFNTNTRLQGSIQQGNMATQMRNANDALLTFNKAQSLQQQRFQDQYAADQQNAAWGRGVDVSNAGFQQSNNIARNAGIQSNAGFRQSEDMSTNAGRLSDAQFTQSGNLSRNATNLANADLMNIGQQGQRAGEQTRIGAGMNSDWLTGTQNVGNMSMQAQRDNTSALGMAGDMGFKQAALDASASSEHNAMRQKIIDSAAEDRRAKAAEQAASDEAAKARRDANSPHSLIDYMNFKSADW